MKLREFIDMILAEMPAKTKVNFDIAVKPKTNKVTKNTELYVTDTGYGYDSRNKIKFSLTKLD
jgi:hypothetical protein